VRFNEKSFELRFCATLSAAAMPFNRNPQWFGMTQAHERLNGIDAMLKTGGGNLLIFQFKASSKQVFRLDKSQWRSLARLEKRFPGSTYYALPGVDDLASAAGIKCLLKDSWLVRPSDVGPAFPAMARSTGLSLDVANNALKRRRPFCSVPAKRFCSSFGCFCQPTQKQFQSDLVRSFLRFSVPSGEVSEQTTAFEDSIGSAGVPIGDFNVEGVGDAGIGSPGQFENLIAEDDRFASFPNLMGLFLPRTHKVES
jgi:hypothetical protein